MRELGEGVPRMFDTMEREGLKPPELRLEADVIFTVTLYNTLVYPPETVRWLRQFEEMNLSPNQKRLLAYAHAHDGAFTSRAYQKLVGIDIYAASKEIKDLIRKGIVRHLKKGGRVYQVNINGSRHPASSPEFERIQPVLQEKGYVTNKDVQRILKTSRLQAARLLKEWCDSGHLLRQGKARATRYVKRIVSSS